MREVLARLAHELTRLSTRELTLMAALSGCEMGLMLAGVRLRESGMTAAMEYLTATVSSRP